MIDSQVTRRSVTRLVTGDLLFMFQTHSHLQTIVGFITVLSVTAINMVEQQVIHTAIMVPNWFGSWRTEAKNWREQLTN